MQESESLVVTWRPIGEIRPYSGNPRRITDVAIEKVAQSLKEFGWRQPIVVDEDGFIVVGHTRFLAALRLNLERAPVHVATGLTGEQVKAYRLADNRTHDETEWDFPALGLELQGLQRVGYDVGLTAFTDADLARAFAPAPSPITSADITNEWRGMPSFDHEDQDAFRSIKVHFRNQADIDAFAKLIGQEITEKARWVWYPPQERERFADKRYVAGDEATS